MRLKDKVALITGAGSGIGRQAALLFAREGAALLVVDVNDAGGNETVAMVKQAGGRAAYCRADVSKARDAEQMVSAAEREFGGAVPVSQQAIAPNAHKARRQNMQQKASHELLSCNGHCLLPVAVSVIFPAEADRAIFHREEAVI